MNTYSKVPLPVGRGAAQWGLGSDRGGKAPEDDASEAQLGRCAQSPGAPKTSRIAVSRFGRLL